ncbi:MAG: tyrosine-type recombinase/integrase [Prevotellaceae bacterium]|jgi:integrase|nr:tyrosine-type recombinase/integrase [Prevotellaceae bacterium]
MIVKFREYLKKKELSNSTIVSYVWTANYYLLYYGNFSRGNLLAYKNWLIKNYRPQTVNARLQGLNKFLEFAKKPHLKIKFVKVHNRNYLENVISDADYRFLKNQLQKDGLIEWYFVVWFLAATGARISELLQIKVEHVHAGYLDMYTKNGAIRRLYIPKNLRDAALSWLTLEKNFSGYIFKNYYGKPISSKFVYRYLKMFAQNYGINTQVVYPHSFRHRFAKNFLEQFNDLALLADLMGHKSIETTRIYLRRTAFEQQQIVDTIITW